MSGILDLVRHAARRFLPRRGALGRDEGGRVLERHDPGARVGGPGGNPGHAGLEHAGADLQRRLARAGRRSRAREELGERGEGLGREKVLRAREPGVLVAAEQAPRGLVEEIQRVVVAERDDAGVEPREDRAHAAALLVDALVRRGELGVRGDELGPALAQLGRHRVEGARERGDLVASLHLDERVEVARADTPRRGGERRDRARHAAREEEPDPHGREENEEREEEEEEHLHGLELRALGLQHRVRRGRARELAQRLGLGGRVERADDEEPGGQRDDRPSGLPAVARGLEPPRNASRLRVREPLGAGIVHVAQRPPRGADGHGRAAGAPPLDEVDARLFARGREEGDEAAVGDRREPGREAFGRPALEGRRPRADEVGDLPSGAHRLLDGRREPAFDALLQEAGGGQDEERDRQEREAHVRRDDAHAEARSEDAAARLDDELRRAPHEHEDEREDEDDDDVEEDEEKNAVRRGDGREVARAQDERVAAGERRAEGERDRDEDPVVPRPAPSRQSRRRRVVQRAPLAVHSKIPDRTQTVSALVGTTPRATPLP